MISDSGFDSGSSPELASEDPPMSRTHQYRKVMKPLLERKRRARINKCLDDLKDLMVTALKSEGESITKLEKADVLELTVKYLRKLKRQNALGLTPQATYAAKFRVGYVHCAQDVSRFMSSMQATGNSSSVDVHVSTRLLSHLANCCQALETMSPSVVSMAMSPPPPPMPVTPQTSSLPVYSHLPTSAFSPVIAHSPVEQRHLLPVKEESERFEVRSNGKENQAMDLSKSTYNRIPSRQMIEPITQAKDDPNWRPW